MSYSHKSIESACHDETANTLTHAVGTVMFLAGSVALLIKAHLYHDLPAIISAWVFSISLVVLYSASTLYHFVTNPTYKKVFHLIDHCAIFLLIAGTYTPFLVVSLRNDIHHTFLITMWTIAAAGIFYKVFMIKKYRLFSTLIYLAMGWMAIFKIHVFYAVLPAPALWLLLAGGLSYTVGTIFYSRENIRYNHAIWHLFVLCGSGCHYIAIYLYVFKIP
ncbi:MAG: hemolysin III family protein [Cyclobacteriaceae bacterium]|nr:hemolysin III family protein [Cyclobacteriaceae bacterium]